MPPIGPFERFYVATWRYLDTWIDAHPTPSILLRQILYELLFAIMLWLLSVTITPAAPDTLHVDAIGQVVPAIVIAVFVFGVGTAFVIAQVVPPTRGTRAIEFLQGRRFGSTITPALALVTGSAVLLGLSADGWVDREALALALLLGSAVYVVWSTASLLSIYRDATDPRMFRRLLLSKQQPRWPARSGERIHGVIVRLGDPSTRKRQAAESSSQETDRSGRPDGEPNTEDCASEPGHGQQHRAEDGFSERQAQSAAERLYRVIRTARGWARVAAYTGDSRELHESLECVIMLVAGYSKPPFGIKCTVPGRTYPMSAPRSFAVDRINPRDVLWSLRTKDCGEAHDCTKVRAPYSPWAGRARPDTWFANEVGRALVRAAEYGLRTGNLLDRDLLRLLNTMVLCTEHFSAGWPSDCARSKIAIDAPTERGHAAGVMLRYLVEVGMAVRWSSGGQLEWFYSPAIHLGRLSSSLLPNIADKTGAKIHRELALGATAGLVLVVDSILWREDQDRQVAVPPNQNRRADEGELERRAVQVRKSLAAHGVEVRLEEAQREQAVCLATSSILRPEERPVVNESRRERLRVILDGLCSKN